MKKRLIALAVSAAMLVPLGLSACGKGGTGSNPDADKDAKNWYKDYAEVTAEDYNKNLYYLNELKFQIADPSVIWVPEGQMNGAHDEDEGYFYAYGTSDMANCHGIQCWRSKDLTNWEFKSNAFVPDFNKTWAFNNYWAPEVMFDEESQHYLMFYNADYTEKDVWTSEWYLKGDQYKQMSVVWSETPYGPFLPMTDEAEYAPIYDFGLTNNLIPKHMQRAMAIDAHPFVDPVSGDKYLYYSGFGRDGNNRGNSQTIFGVKMNSWTEPDYSTLKQLTKNHNTTVDGNDDDIPENGYGVNEGPFMWYKDGTYYLTYSICDYRDPMYQVRQALATDPLGNFTKIQPDDGGQVLVSDLSWGTMAGTGHHCFIECGDELIIAYHAYLNREDISDGRALAVDTISWVENAKGQKLMHANGPTYSYQPLPEAVSGYKNLTPLAEIEANNTADGSSVDYLSDETIKVHSRVVNGEDADPVREFRTSGGKTEITLSFNKFVNARSIMVYNSKDYDYAFTGINSIKLQCKGVGDTTVERVIKNVGFDFDWHTDSSTMVYPGATSVAEFDELAVNKITITINAPADTLIGINEIVVLGKETSNPKPITQLAEYEYEQIADVSPIPVYESRTFGSAGDGRFVSDYGFNLDHDDGTADAYVEKNWTGNNQNLYFKDVESTVLYMETEMTIGEYTKAYMFDEAPKTGIVLRTARGYFVTYNIDCGSDFKGQSVGYTESNSSGSDYDWSKYKTYTVGGLKYTGESYAKLAIARVDGIVYLFANDRLIDTITTLRGFSADDSTACAVAFVTFNCYTKYKNYYITADISKVTEKLSGLGVAV